MAGGIGGDPHITRIDGVTFDFTKGRPGATYRLFEHGDTQIRCTLKAIPGVGSGPARTIMADLTIAVGAVVVAVPLDLNIRVMGPRFDIALKAFACTLPAHDPAFTGLDADGFNPIPYMNATMLRQPDDLSGAFGLQIDGEDTDESETAHRLHG